VSERETERERTYEPYEWAPLYSESAEPREDERDYRPIHPEPAWRGLARKLAAPLVFLAAIVWKFKAVALAVFKFKIFTTAGTMLVSVGAYALVWGWWFAVGFVLLLLVHELGHALEAKRQGLDVSAPLFIPFLGAAILLKEQPQDVWREFKIAAAGPILGSIGAAACLAVHAWSGRDFWLALAFVGFFLNLLNLAPIWQLDGGRMVSAIHPALWIPGLIAMAALLFFYPNPILILIVVLGALQVWDWWRHRDASGAERYYAISPGRRALAGLVYLGLIAVLAVATSATHLERDF
jgi:Zn-dependent protease